MYTLLFVCGVVVASWFLAWIGQLLFVFALICFLIWCVLIVLVLWCLLLGVGCLLSWVCVPGIVTISLLFCRWICGCVWCCYCVSMLVCLLYFGFPYLGLRAIWGLLLLGGFFALWGIVLGVVLLAGLGCELFTSLVCWEICVGIVYFVAWLLICVVYLLD